MRVSLHFVGGGGCKVQAIYSQISPRGVLFKLQ